MKALTTAGLFLFTALALAGCGNDRPATPDSVTVSGSGEISAQPDIFRVVATARENGSDIDAMKGRVDDRVGAMLDLADDLEIEASQVTARELRISPQWQYRPKRKLIGHEVSREVIFRVSGLDRYARLLDGLAKQGLRDIRPGGAEVSNADELANRALKAAVADARQRAEILAEAAGRSLGKARQIQSQSLDRPQPVMRMAARESASSSYRAGETQITARVQITFELN